MEFSGRYAIPAPPEAVWAALNDPDVLKGCIPGCQSILRTDPTHFDATATLKIGPVKATFNAKIEQTDLDPPRRCILKGEGQGGVAGFARGEAEVVLAPEGGGTLLSYKANAAIGGKLAQIGQRLIDGAAKQIADDFFKRFAAAVTAGTIAAEALPAELPPSVPEPPQDAPEEQGKAAGIAREGLAPEIWVVGLIAIIVILLVLFGVAL
jgi:carbon monoxide dehydrogenase subunit G